MDAILLGLVAIGVLLLVGAGVLGVPLGIYQAWRKNGTRWWTPTFLISWQSVVIVFVIVAYLVILALVIAD